MIAPTLHTGRLTLRMPVLGDFDHHAAFHASTGAGFEGDAKSRKSAWNIWAGDVVIRHDLRGRA